MVAAATWLGRAPTAAALALLVLLLPIGGARASTTATKFPFQNLQDMVNKGTADAAAATAEATTVSAADALAPAGSAAKLAFLQAAKKDGVDPIALFEAAINSKAFKQIYDNVEIQHRLLESMPILEAFPGFAEVKGRRLSDAETTAGFAKGMKAFFDFNVAFKNVMANPTVVNDKIVELSQSEDAEVQELFRGARANDEGSVRAIQNLVAKDIYPGVDINKVAEVLEGMNFDKLLSMPEMQRFIDQDPIISEKLRMPKSLATGAATTGSVTEPTQPTQ